MRLYPFSGSTRDTHMKTGIHPTYSQITVTCACGNTFQVGSTLKEDLRVEICANCHPLYTGKSKLVDTAGRVDKFQARRDRAAAMKTAAQGRQDAKAAQATEEPKAQKKEQAAK